MGWNVGAQRQLTVLCREFKKIFLFIYLFPERREGREKERERNISV